MQLENRVGLLVPTYNRPFFVRKLLRYYSRLESAPSIVFADSSEPGNFSTNADSIALFPKLRVTHVATPKMRLMVASGQALPHLNGPYTILTGDDDFLEPHALSRMAAFLDGKPDYQVAISGIVRPHLGYKDGRLFIQRILPGSSGLSSLEDSSAGRRLTRVFSPTQVNTFALHRTAGFKRIISRNAAAAFENELTTFPLAEIMHIGLTVVLGKQKFFPGTYLAMCLYIPSRADSHPEGRAMKDLMLDARWQPGAQHLLDVWTTVLCEKDGIDRDAAHAIALEGYFTWMKDFHETRSPKWKGSRPDMVARVQHLARLGPMITAANIIQKFGQNRGRGRRALLQAVEEVLAHPEEKVSPMPPQTPASASSR